MLVINARNVNDALTLGVRQVLDKGRAESSRNGPVLRVPEPVTTVYEKPMERVLFHPWRDANPFFHLVEALWMIAGRNDLKQLTPYVKRMADFSDDGGKTQPGAYGYRWRGWFGGTQQFDQLGWAVRRLQKDPGDRRVVISMWDGKHDPRAVEEGSRDVPCNLQVLPYVVDGRLNITVTNRSNDAILGAYGANAVHFSVLLEYLATRLDLSVGTYTQVSNNLHIYAEGKPKPDPEWSWKTFADSRDSVGGRLLGDPYGTGQVWPSRMFLPEDGATFADEHETILQQDLAVFFQHGAQEAVTKARFPFIRRTLCPMVFAHQHFKKAVGESRYLVALEILSQVEASDWRLAATEWIQRRYDAWKIAADDGANHP